MDKHIIGRNAGVIWNLLAQENRKWEFSEVEQATGFNDAELGAAIGWLARENKIQFELEPHNSKAGKAYLSLPVNVYI